MVHGGGVVSKGCGIRKGQRLGALMVHDPYTIKNRNDGQGKFTIGHFAVNL